MSDQVGLSIIAAECKSACAGEPDLEKRILKAMAPVVNGHWMFTNNEDLCFRGALGGVLLSEETTEAEKEKITRSLKAMRTVSALLSGVPVDVEAALEEQKDCLPLMKMWREAKVK